LTILFGILAVALLNYWAGYVGFAIWGGIWVSSSQNFVLLLR